MSKYTQVSMWTDEEKVCKSGLNAMAFEHPALSVTENPS